MEPISTQFLETLFVGVIVLIPVIGITARFALKPIAEAMVHLRGGAPAGEALQMLERRMALVEQEVQNLAAMREEMTRLADAQQFHLRLLSEKAERDASPGA